MADQEPQSPSLDMQVILARSIYERAVLTASDGSDVSLMTAMLLLDAAVETLTKAACRHKDVRPPKGEGLGDLADALLQKCPAIGHGNTGRVRRLRDARNQVQHAGGALTAATVSRFIEDARAWLTKVCLVVFGLDFDRVTMASQVRDPRLRRLLDDAIACRDSGKLPWALRFACAAFELLRIRWERAVGYADGFGDDRAAFISRRMSGLLWQIAAIYDDTRFHETTPQLADDRYRPLSRITLGFTIDELRRLRGLVARCETQAWDQKKRTRATPEEVDFAITAVARQVWRLETLHPDALIKMTPARPMPKRPQAGATKKKRRGARTDGG